MANTFHLTQDISKTHDGFPDASLCPITPIFG